MKKSLACLLAVALAFSMTGCGGSKSAESGQSAETAPAGQTTSDAAAKPASSGNLKTVSLTAEAYEGEDCTASATIGYPEDAFSCSEDSEDSCTFKNEAGGYEVGTELYCDENYTDNIEATKEMYEGWQEIHYGDFDGYAYLSDGGDYEMYILLESTDYEDIYLYMSYEPEGTEEVDVKAAVESDDAMQQLLNSITYDGINK